MIRQILRDNTLWAALMVAPFILGLLYLSIHPLIDLKWVLKKPMRFSMLAVVYPILEEVVFRGWFQPTLYKITSRSFHGVSAANMITSIVFVLFHLWNHPVIWALAVFAPSIVFGFFRDKYESVKPAIGLHVYYNASFFIIFQGAQAGDNM